jgi:alkaline phosphatase
MVPVFAEGPGASLFGGIYESNEIYHKMMGLFDK